MKIITQIIDYPTDARIGIYNLNDRLEAEITATGIKNGHVLVFSRHTTTAIAINEYEERLLADIKTYLQKLAPEGDRYLHNDLHLRDVPPDEPINAHAHLMAMTLNNSEIVPIVDGKLGLGTYQAVMLLELDGPRQRTVLLQICGA
jgi:secondary thiamine-phosphate synthase enzyme